MARNTDTVGESTKTRKTPQRRALSHLPATCQAALEVLNDAAWEMSDGLAGEGPTTVLFDAAKRARKILRDGLAVVEPTSE